MKKFALLLVAVASISLNSCGDDDKRYWINRNTNKTHNSSCRYYENCNGYYSSTGSGNDCKICGGE